MWEQSDIPTRNLPWPTTLRRSTIEKMAVRPANATFYGSKEVQAA
ncbi:hypothetical protein ACFVW1_35615 [Streptomyces olivochromogenes]